MSRFDVRPFHSKAWPGSGLFDEEYKFKLQVMTLAIYVAIAEELKRPATYVEVHYVVMWRLCELDPSLVVPSKNKEYSHVSFFELAWMGLVYLKIIQPVPSG